MAVAGTITERIIQIRQLLDEPVVKSWADVKKEVKLDKQARAERAKKDREDRMAQRLLAKQSAMERKKAEKRAAVVMDLRKKRRQEEEKYKPDPADNNFKPIRDKPLPTRPLNLDAKIAVRLDHKTVVYANPGYDIEELKLKYLSKLLF